MVSNVLYSDFRDRVADAPHIANSKCLAIDCLAKL
jgi:hypothetical protein